MKKRDREKLTRIGSIYDADERRKRVQSYFAVVLFLIFAAGGFAVLVGIPVVMFSMGLSLWWPVVFLALEMWLIVVVAARVAKLKSGGMRSSYGYAVAYGGFGGGLSGGFGGGASGGGGGGGGW